MAAAGWGLVVPESLGLGDRRVPLGAGPGFGDRIRRDRGQLDRCLTSAVASRFLSTDQPSRRCRGIGVRARSRRWPGDHSSPSTTRSSVMPAEASRDRRVRRSGMQQGRPPLPCAVATTARPRSRASSTCRRPDTNTARGAGRERADTSGISSFTRNSVKRCPSTNTASTCDHGTLGAGQLLQLDALAGEDHPAQVVEEHRHECEKGNHRDQRVTPPPHQSVTPMRTAATGAAYCSTSALQGERSTTRSSSPMEAGWHLLLGTCRR